MPGTSPSEEEFPVDEHASADLAARLDRIEQEYAKTARELEQSRLHAHQLQQRLEVAEY